MENVLNRRMFQQPIYAQEGVYVPTIEQIMNFYMGGFDDQGQPTDMEDFERAMETAKKANAAGLFDKSGPIDTWLQYPSDELIQFGKENNIEGYNDPLWGRYHTPGGVFKPSQDKADFLTNLLETNARKEASIREQEAKFKEESAILGAADAKAVEKAETDKVKGAFIQAMEDTQDFTSNTGTKGEDNRYIKELLNIVRGDKAAETNAKESAALQRQRLLELTGANTIDLQKRNAINEQEYAQKQSAMANQKRLFNELKGTKVRNLAGDREQDVSQDENVKMILRNILQGTNIIEPGTDEFKNLSAADRMKVKDALSEKRKEELDITDVSKKGMENIIDAAGESTEVAIEIWNEMKNFGGEVAEGADEMLTGWKDAISSGWSEERKKELNDQLDFLKTKNRDSSDNKGPQFLFPGSATIGGWLLDKSGILSKKATNEQPPKQKENWGESGPRDKELDLANRVDPTGLDTSIFKEDEGGEGTAESIVSELNKKMDQLLDARDNNLIDEETFKKEMNIINDQKNKLQKIANEGKEGRSLWADVFGEKWDPENDPYIQYFDKKIDEAFNNGGDLNEDGTISPGELFKFHLQKKKSKGGKPPKQKENWGESETRDKELDLANRVDPTVSVEDVEKLVTEAEGGGEEEVVVKKEITTDTNTGLPIDITGGKGESPPVGDPDIAADLDAALAGADTATVTTDTVGLNAVNGAVPAGTSAMAKLIAETAKETGYNFGAMDQTKDDLALKAILYGLKLATTPGKFSDAVLATGFEAVKNEINERYKTKASKQKFAGTLFSTMLAGKLDIEKEKVKAANKAVVQKKYDFGKNFQASTLARIQTGDPNKGLGFDLSGLGLDDEMNEDNEGAKMFVLDIMDEMQMLANRAVTANPKTEEVDADKLFNQAVENLSPVYKIVTKDLFSIMSFLDKNVWLPGDWEPPTETTIERLRTDTKPRLTSTVSSISAEDREEILKQFKDFPVTEAIVKQQMKEHNKTRDEVIAEFEKVGADISGV
tara:strand:+ start:2572 stop:5589 length:3018 start_codon:yes stop_codon:yes gene_type:complete